MNALTSALDLLLYEAVRIRVYNVSTILLDSLVILLLILINGIFALAEIAMVSARRVRLQQRGDTGDKGARVALELMSEPTRFLSTVQTGITLIGIFAGAFGGTTIANYLSAHLAAVPTLAPYSDAISLGIVVLIISYLSLVFGELLPKRLALNNPERLASIMSRPMRFLSVIFAPVVYILSASTNVVARLLGIRPAKELPVTAEEISILLEQGERAGIFEPTEQDIIENTLRLDDLRVSALITPRMEVVWLDIDETPENKLATVVNSPHTSFPVAKENLDNVVGIVSGRDVLISQLMSPPAEISTLMMPPVFVPESKSTLEMLELFKQSGQHMALVIDEFGGMHGLVTMTDIMEALVGEIRGPGLPEEPESIRLESGAWLLDGRLPLQEFMEHLDIRELPEEAEEGFDTLGGFVMAMLGRIPAEGDSFEYTDKRFEVEKMDGKRVDQVRVKPLPRQKPSGERES